MFGDEQGWHWELAWRQEQEDQRSHHASQQWPRVQLDSPQQHTFRTFARVEVLERFLSQKLVPVRKSGQGSVSDVDAHAKLDGGMHSCAVQAAVLRGLTKSAVPMNRAVTVG